jgi:hypothetical protein
MQLLPKQQEQSAYGLQALGPSRVEPCHHQSAPLTRYQPAGQVQGMASSTGDDLFKSYVENER